jgi:hypothetical protein
MIDDITFENSMITLDTLDQEQTELILGVGLDLFNYENKDQLILIEIM